MNGVQKSIVLTGFTMAITSIFLMTIGNYVFAIEYKNYTSDKYKIQFEYPSDWTVTEKTSTFDSGIDITIKSGTNHLYIYHFDDSKTVSGWGDVEKATPMWLRSEQSSRKDIEMIIKTPSYLTIDEKKAGTFLLALKLKQTGLEVAQQFWLVSVGDRIYHIFNMEMTRNFDSPENRDPQSLYKFYQVSWKY